MFKKFWRQILYQIGYYSASLTPKGVELLDYLHGVIEGKKQPYNEDFEMMLTEEGKDRFEVAKELIDILEGANK